MAHLCNLYNSFLAVLEREKRTFNKSGLIIEHMVKLSCYQHIHHMIVQLRGLKYQHCSTLVRNLQFATLKIWKCDLVSALWFCNRICLYKGESSNDFRDQLHLRTEFQGRNLFYLLKEKRNSDYYSKYLLYVNQKLHL